MNGIERTRKAGEPQRLITSSMAGVRVGKQRSRLVRTENC